MSHSVWPHRWQPTRLPHPWDSLGKNTGVGCHFLLQCMKVKSESEVAQSCLTLSDPMDCSLPGSSIHGIFQARVLEQLYTKCTSKVILYIVRYSFELYLEKILWDVEPEISLEGRVEVWSRVFHWDQYVWEPAKCYERYRGIPKNSLVTRKWNAAWRGKTYTCEVIVNSEVFKSCKRSELREISES